MQKRRSQHFQGHMFCAKELLLPRAASACLGKNAVTAYFLFFSFQQVNSLARIDAVAGCYSLGSFSGEVVHHAYGEKHESKNTSPYERRVLRRAVRRLRQRNE